MRKREFNEDTRVKIHATLHLTRLGYKYILIKNQILSFSSVTSIKHVGSSIPHLKIAFKDSIFTDFSSFINPIFEKTYRNKIENRKLAEICDWLLPLLMSGQLKARD